MPLTSEAADDIVGEKRNLNLGVAIKEKMVGFNKELTKIGNTALMMYTTFNSKTKKMLDDLEMKVEEFRRKINTDRVRKRRRLEKIAKHPFDLIKPPPSL